ncbi:hypothetical protein ACULLL_01755 [Lysinibacillus irui]|uniref:hypothetical protein n=1 Tax=Lysinibacillus irui TaxID=2998077 RepID=UPI0040445A78
MLTTEYTIDNLTTTNVSVKTQRYYEQYPLGEPHRKAYMNSSSSRAELEKEVPQAQVNAVFAVWGDKPTVEE